MPCRDVSDICMDFEDEKCQCSGFVVAQFAVIRMIQAHTDGAMIFIDGIRPCDLLNRIQAKRPFDGLKAEINKNETSNNKVAETPTNFTTNDDVHEDAIQF